jgi:hypothetical protein
MKSHLQKATFRSIEVLTFSVGILLLGVTFFAFNSITPTIKQQNSVLGARSESKLVYYPADISNNALVKQTELTYTNINNSEASVLVSLNKMDKATYSIPLLQISNTENKITKVKIVAAPNEQLPNTKVALIINGVAITVIEKNGQLIIPEVILDPVSITPIVLEITTDSKINSTPSLKIDFTPIE